VLPGMGDAGSASRQRRASQPSLRTSPARALLWGGGASWTARVTGVGVACRPTATAPGLGCAVNASGACVTARAARRPGCPGVPGRAARRLAAKLEFHYIPKHASWLNMAELELSVLGRKCLNRRLPDRATLTREVAAWKAKRNAAEAKADWQFTTADARTKLKRLYPTTQLQ